MWSFGKNGGKIDMFFWGTRFLRISEIDMDFLAGVRIDDAIACQISPGIGDSFQDDRELNTLTLPETNIAMENPPFWWYLQGKMGFSWAMLVSGRVSVKSLD